VAPGDAAALARTCVERLGDERERERLGSAAALDVRRRLASARQIQKIEALYAAVLGGDA
jgi:hypothetical protein